MTSLEPLLRELLGQALRSRRRKHGRTLADVAAQAGVSMQHLSDVERGRKDASSEMLAAICGALGTSVAELMIAATRPPARALRRPVVLDLTRSPRERVHEIAAPGRAATAPGRAASAPHGVLMASAA